MEVDKLEHQVSIKLQPFFFFALLTNNDFQHLSLT